MAYKRSGSLPGGHTSYYDEIDEENDRMMVGQWKATLLYPR